MHVNRSKSKYVPFSIMIGVAIISGTVVYNNLSNRFSNSISSNYVEPPSYIPDISGSEIRDLSIPTTNIIDGRKDWEQTLVTAQTERININTENRRSIDEIKQTLTGEFSVRLVDTVTENLAQEKDVTQSNMAIAQLMGDVLEKIEYKEYTVRDIRIIYAYTGADVADYLATVGTIYLEYEPENIEGRTILENLSLYVDNRNEGIANIISIQNTQIKTMIDQLLQLQVPRDMVDVHISLINTLYIKSQNIDNILNISDDVLLGQASYNRYIATYWDYVATLQVFGMRVINFQDYFDDLNNTDATVFVLLLPDLKNIEKLINI